MTRPGEKEDHKNHFSSALLPLSIGDTTILLPCNLSGSGSSLRKPSSLPNEHRPPAVSLRLPLNAASVLKLPANISNDIARVESEERLSRLHGPGWCPLSKQNVRPIRSYK